VLIGLVLALALVLALVLAEAAEMGLEAVVVGVAAGAVSPERRRLGSGPVRDWDDEEGMESARGRRREGVDAWRVLLPGVDVSEGRSVPDGRDCMPRPRGIQLQQLELLSRRSWWVFIVASYWYVLADGADSCCYFVVGCRLANDQKVWRVAGELGVLILDACW
jgi:hypothetical protein